MEKSFHSHVGQDRWVSEVYRGQMGGIFLDFGAFDGITTSNTYYLEKQLSWSGICVEANPRYYIDCCKVRSCVTLNVALWPESRKRVEMIDAHGLSCLTDFSEEDCNAELRRSIAEGIFTIDTLNPTELLSRFGMPSAIHYLSIDLEGAELEVLRHLDFDCYRFGAISIEHNQGKNRNAVRSIMIENGYECCELRNDDLFYDVDTIYRLSNGACEHPEHVRNRVLNSYILTE